jgi:hypothetical protein
MATVRSTGEFRTDVKGLDEFRAELKALGAKWPKQLGQANKEAAEIVADLARTKARSLGGVHRHVAPSIKAAAQARHAVVVGGGAAYDMFLGAEFGAKQYERFPPWRGNQWQPDAISGVGYMIHPAARESREEVIDVYDDAIRRLAAQAFPDGP